MQTLWQKYIQRISKQLSLAKMALASWKGDEITWTAWVMQLPRYTGRALIQSWGLIMATAAFLVAIVFVLSLSIYGLNSTAFKSEQGYTLVIKPGTGGTRVIQQLSETLKNPAYFKLLAYARGDILSFKYGEYSFYGSESPNMVLNRLVGGEKKIFVLTIPEGYSIRDIAEKINQLGVGDAEEFVRLATDKDFIQSLNLLDGQDLNSLEGFLFPDTYFIDPNYSAESLIRMMVNMYLERVKPRLLKRPAGLELSPYEVLILASMIEKETGLPSERSHISGVFHNRLRLGMRMDSDPTVIYGIKNFNGNITRKDLRTKTPYNTYTMIGLPPTPISNPGVESVDAALNPKNIPHLFFVSKGDGSHIFSEDLRTHEQAVDRYQRNINN